MTGVSLNTLTTEQRDALILDHMALLHHIVGQLFVDIPGGVEREDLEGYAMVGLIAAADSWDPGRGLKFSTYAFPKIRGAILDELRRQDFLPRGRREKVRALDGIVKQIEQERGAPPEPKELAERMGVSELEVDEILASARLSMQASLDEGPSEQLGALLSDPRSQDPVGSASWEETKELLAVRIGELPEQERQGRRDRAAGFAGLSARPGAGGAGEDVGRRQRHAAELHALAAAA